MQSYRNNVIEIKTNREYVDLTLESFIMWAHM